MKDVTYIKQELFLQGLPVCEADLPYIHNIMNTINLAQTALISYCDLNSVVPITVVDKELIR